MTADRGVLFRVDAGQAHGLGHLQRCLSLAMALDRYNLPSVFVTSPDADVERRITDAGWSWVGLPMPVGTDQDTDDVVQLARARDLCAVVVDSFGSNARYLSGLRDAGFVVVAIDDLAAIPFAAHVVVNGSAHAERLPYAAAAHDVVFLLGPRYAMLRQEFWQRTRSDGEGGSARVLIAMGGADPHDFVPRILPALAVLSPEVQIDVVVGPFAHNRAAVEQASRDIGRTVILHVAPSAVRALMEQATLAISAAGQTLYELACVGCPTIALQTADNQRDQLEALADAGVVEPVPDARPDTVIPVLIERVQALLADPQRRSAMSEAGWRLVDGQGALRVAEAIAGRLIRKVRPVPAQGNRADWEGLS